MSDLNKAPNDFFDNWNKIQSMSYKNVIELLVKRSSEKKILALIQFELDQFSENVQKDLVISETSSFYQEISNLFRDSNWWSTATVTDACKYYLNCARNNISYFENYVEADSDLSQNQKNEIFALYQEEANSLVDKKLTFPALDFVLKCSHCFNLLDARGVISVTDRAQYIEKIRKLAREEAFSWMQERESLNFPLLKKN